MAVIDARTYKLISDELGAAYGLLRDALYNSSSSEDDVYTRAQNTQDLIDLVEDDGYLGSGQPLASATPAESDDPSSANFTNWISSARGTSPPAAIANDLGTFWFRFINTSASPTQAKVTASNFFRNALTQLNTHVVNRMYGYSTITAYYNSYATGISSINGGSLFETDGDGLPPFDYFTSDFAELSAQLGITIPAEYVA